MRITIATHRRHGKFTVSQIYQEKGSWNKIVKLVLVHVCAYFNTYRILKMEVEDDLPLPALSERSELMEPFHIQQVRLQQ